MDKIDVQLHQSYISDCPCAVRTRPNCVHQTPLTPETQNSFTKKELEVKNVVKMYVCIYKDKRILIAGGGGSFFMRFRISCFQFFYCCGFMIIIIVLASPLFLCNVFTISCLFCVIRVVSCFTLTVNFLWCFNSVLSLCLFDFSALLSSTFPSFAMCVIRNRCAVYKEPFPSLCCIACVFYASFSPLVLSVFFFGFILWLFWIPSFFF